MGTLYNIRCNREGTEKTNLTRYRLPVVVHSWNLPPPAHWKAVPERHERSLPQQPQLLIGAQSWSIENRRNVRLQLFGSACLIGRLPFRQIAIARLLAHFHALEARPPFPGNRPVQNDEESPTAPYSAGRKKSSCTGQVTWGALFGRSSAQIVV